MLGSFSIDRLLDGNILPTLGSHALVRFTSLLKISMCDRTTELPHNLRSGKDILSPLFVLSNLTSVWHTLRNNFDIDNNVMETMSKAWPRLRKFALSGQAITLLGSSSIDMILLGTGSVKHIFQCLH